MDKKPRTRKKKTAVLWADFTANMRISGLQKERITDLCGWNKTKRYNIENGLTPLTPAEQAVIKMVLADGGTFQRPAAPAAESAPEVKPTKKQSLWQRIFG